MHVVGHIHHGPAWQSGIPVTQQGEAMAQHLRYMKQLYDAGELILGGPYDRADGGIAVFVTDSVEHAQQLAAADPACRAGVLRYRVEPLRAVFDAATDTDRSRAMAATMRRASMAGRSMVDHNGS